LLKKIQGDRLSSKESELILFGILCLQLSFEEAYTYFVSNIRDFNSIEDLNKLTGEEYFFAKDEGKSLAEELNLEVDDVYKMTKLMKSIVSTIDEENPLSPSDEKFHNFIDLVGISTLTSAYAAETDGSSLENELRWKNRELCKSIKTVLDEELPNTEFKIYQPRKNHDYWKRTNACVYTSLKLAGFSLDVELQIFSDLETKRSTMNIRLAFYTNSRDDEEKISKLLSEHSDIFDGFSRYLEDICYIKELQDVTDFEPEDIISYGSKEFKQFLEALSEIGKE